MTLDVDDIEALAARVLELLREGEQTSPLVDAAELARILGVERDWVYARATELGALRLGDGPKSRLRFDVRRVRERLTERAETQPRPAVPVPASTRRARTRPLPPGVRPVRARPSG